VSARGREMAVAILAAHRNNRVGRLANQMGKWVDQVLGPEFGTYCPGESWTPAINICEGDEHFFIIVDLAGCKGEHIDLRTEGRKLTLSGFRQVPGAEVGAGKVQIRHMEIDHGPFSRTLDLPPHVDADKVDATYRGGYLWINMPKR